MNVVRRPLRIAILTAASVCCVLFQRGAPAADSVSDAAAGMQRRYASVRTLTAHFEQRYQAPGVNTVESGTFWMKKPGLMRWEYRLPEEKLFVADGRETFLYVPADRQVTVRSFTDADFRSTPLRFLVGRGDILQSFRALPENEFRARFEGTVIIRLEPREDEPEYAFLSLEMDARTYDLRRIVIRERTGNTSEFVFTGLRTNISVAESQFRFRIPRGIEVIRLDEK